MLTFFVFRFCAFPQRHIGKADGDLEAQKLMDAMDEDGDGGVSMDEFATHVTMGQLGKDKAQIKATFDMVSDRNGQNNCCSWLDNLIDAPRMHSSRAIAALSLVSLSWHVEHFYLIGISLFSCPLSHCCSSIWITTASSLTRRSRRSATS
jgi:hypothetical protein